MVSLPGILQSSQNTLWYTPRTVWKAAFDVMGGIDLDPCGCDGRDDRSLAGFTYREKDDGLTKPWFGRTYLNPPFGRGIEKWINRCLHFYRSGEVSQAIIACPASTETKWFSPLYEHVICFQRGRCFFIDGRTGEAPPKGGPTPIAMVYLGSRRDEFRNVFSQFGSIVQPYRSLENIK